MSGEFSDIDTFLPVRWVVLKGTHILVYLKN